MIWDSGYSQVRVNTVVSVLEPTDIGSPDKCGLEPSSRFYHIALDLRNGDWGSNLID